MPVPWATAHAASARPAAAGSGVGQRDVDGAGQAVIGHGSDGEPAELGLRGGEHLGQRRFGLVGAGRGGPIRVRSGGFAGPGAAAQGHNVSARESA